MSDAKQRVREFYDEVGWAQDAEGLFQNARFEDLRPVSRVYIRKCHLRVNRYLSVSGLYLLDAGSGPVQWPEYLTYSEGYRFRVCVDLSATALRAARYRLGSRGLYVVADIANLPFGPNVFDGLVSFHAIHHLPFAEQRGAYVELNRVLVTDRTGVVVNGWYRPFLMRLAEPFIHVGRLLTGRPIKRKKERNGEMFREGTFVRKMTASALGRELGDEIAYEILPWRSLSPRFMQWFIKPNLGGETLLRFIFWLEDHFPRFFGRHGQYPMIVIRKTAQTPASPLRSRTPLATEAAIDEARHGLA